jgi:hypothetical protein
MSRLKQVCKYLFTSEPRLSEQLTELLRMELDRATPDEFLENLCQQVRLHWMDGGRCSDAPVVHNCRCGQAYDG